MLASDLNCDSRLPKGDNITMAHDRQKQKLALQGGMKAVTQFAGRGQPKIGVGEFMSVAQRFGLSTAAQRKIRAILRG